MEALDQRRLLLLSGGMDSIAIAYWKRPAHALTINYGQRAATAEVLAAETVCQLLGIRHHVLEINCMGLGAGDMAGVASLPWAPTPEWWPFRNQMLVTFAAAYALRLAVREIMIGTLRTDRKNADGSLGFLESMNRILKLQEGELGLVAPARNLTAVGLVNRSGVPLEILRWAHSCHVANHACGACRGCNKRVATWKQLGQEAP
jgi:7-cyano-7-deazaguanine synthase